MISERKFSNSFSSFWSELLPTADSFIRRMNLSLERYCQSTESSLEIDRDKRAVINELAFRFFIKLAKGVELSDRKKVDLAESVSDYIEKLASNIKINRPILKEEIKEAESICGSLATYFTTREFSSLKFWPTFKGCGRMQACKGDILRNNKLIEVKAGDRQFRMTDIRQVITYLSLNSISKQYTIEQIALVNPRKGVFFETTVDILIEECSRRKPVDVFGDIIDYLSAETISK